MLTVTVCSSVFFRGLKPHLVISVMLGVSTTNEPILVLILQPVACSMREVTVQNLRAQACKEQQQTEKRQEQTSPTLTSKQKIKQQTARETATMMSTMMSVESSSSATARRWRARRAMQTQTSQRQNDQTEFMCEKVGKQRCERADGADGADEANGATVSTGRTGLYSA
jgi:transposase